MRLIRAEDGEGDRVGQSSVAKPGLLEAMCEAAYTRLVAGLPLGVLTPWSSWLPARCAEHSWRKQAKLVFPVALVFKGKEELNFQARGKGRGLDPCLSRVLREPNAGSLRPRGLHPNMGRRVEAEMEKPT